MLINTQFTFKMLFGFHIFIFYSFDEWKTEFEANKMHDLNHWALGVKYFFSHWCWICHRYHAVFHTNISISWHNPVPHIYGINTYYHRIHALFDHYFYVSFLIHLLLLQNYEIDTFQFNSMNLILLLPVFILKVFVLFRLKFSSFGMKLDNFHFNLKRCTANIIFSRHGSGLCAPRRWKREKNQPIWKVHSA